MTKVPRYSTGAVLLHWYIAIVLAFQLSLGWRLEDLPKGAIQFAGYQFHKSVGIVILGLSLARLFIRLVAKRPAPVPAPPLQRFAASAVHFGFYGVMILGPITGWIIVSTSKIRMQTMLFGAVRWPSLPFGTQWHDPAATAHSLLAFLFVGLFLLHVAGALYHHVLRDDVIGRMIPAHSRKGQNIAIAAALILILGAMAGAKIVPFGKVNAPVAAPLPQAGPVAPATSEAAPVEDPSEEASAAPSATAEAEQGAVPWAVQKGGRLNFRADYNGSPVVGSFSRWNAAIRFSPEDLAHSTIRVTIDLATVGSGDSERDDMLRGDSFFGIAKHPQAVFAATKVRAVGNGRYLASGTLTMNGISHPVAVAFSLGIVGERAQAKGTATFRRTDFGVGSGEWAATDSIKDDVTVDFAFSALRQAGSLSSAATPAKK